MFKGGGRRSSIPAGFLLIGLALSAATAAVPPKPEDVRATTGSLAITRLPKLSMRIDPTIKYVGAFPFDIRGIAGGYRYVWADIGKRHKARRVFIVQREGYYPAAASRYDYAADNPLRLGGEIYGHNMYPYDNDEAAAERPGNEPDLTRKFFVDRGIDWPPQLIMSRFARIADAEGQNEIIFFYFEPLATYTRKSAADLDALGSNTPEVAKILAAVDRHSRRAFSIAKQH